MSRIKAKLGWVSSYEDDLSSKKIVLPISVGQASHEGEKFAATLRMIEKRFYHCDIVLADTLQRFNLLNDVYSEKETYQLAYQEGTNWLYRNKAYLDELLISYKIIRWDECKKDSLFDSYLNSVKQLYQYNFEYRYTFQEDIEVMKNRYQKRLQTCEILEKYSLNYLFEEIAVVLSYFIDKGYHFILYPGQIPQSVAMSRDLFVAKQHPDLIRSLKIYFKKSQSSQTHDAIDLDQEVLY